MSQILRTASGVKIVEIRDEGIKLVIYSVTNFRKGHYDKSSNITYSASNVKVGTGNLLTTLL
jgi:ribosomal protein S6